jgi:hypothetical protein
MDSTNVGSISALELWADDCNTGINVIATTVGFGNIKFSMTTRQLHKHSHR